MTDPATSDVFINNQYIISMVSLGFDSTLGLQLSIFDSLTKQPVNAIGGQSERAYYLLLTGSSGTLQAPSISYVKIIGPNIVLFGTGYNGTNYELIFITIPLATGVPLPNTFYNNNLWVNNSDLPIGNVLIDSNNNIIISGEYEASAPGFQNGFVTKLDINLNPIASFGTNGTVVYAPNGTNIFDSVVTLPDQTLLVNNTSLIASFQEPGPVGLLVNNLNMINYSVTGTVLANVNLIDSSSVLYQSGHDQFTQFTNSLFLDSLGNSYLIFPKRNNSIPTSTAAGNVNITLIKLTPGFSADVGLGGYGEINYTTPLIGSSPPPGYDIVFHNSFNSNGKIYLAYTTQSKRTGLSLLSEILVFDPVAKTINSIAVYQLGFDFQRFSGIYVNGNLLGAFYSQSYATFIDIYDLTTNLKVNTLPINLILAQYTPENVNNEKFIDNYENIYVPATLQLSSTSIVLNRLDKKGRYDSYYVPVLIQYSNIVGSPISSPILPFRFRTLIDPINREIIAFTYQSGGIYRLAIIRLYVNGSQDSSVLTDVPLPNLSGTFQTESINEIASLNLDPAGNLYVVLQTVNASSAVGFYIMRFKSLLLDIDIGYGTSGTVTYKFTS
jgi:hypothetical protein